MVDDLSTDGTSDCVDVAGSSCMLLASAETTNSYDNSISKEEMDG